MAEALRHGHDVSVRVVHNDAKLIGAMVLAGPEMAAENAVRFLAHLVGDRSFAVDHPGQNLDRCRPQLRLTQRMFESHVATPACFARTARRRRPPQADPVGETQEIV